MEFYIRRASDWHGKHFPCQGAILNPLYEEGYRHSGRGSKEGDSKLFKYKIKIDTLEDLKVLESEVVEALVISFDPSPDILIYDGYIE